MSSTIESIDLHVRTYRSALKSNLEVTISSLTPTHLKMESILHPHGSNSHKLDISAFSYALYRIPSVADKTKLVLTGQNPDVFTQFGYPHITSWTKVSSIARRHTRYFNTHTGIAASLISSISDVDDIVNLLIAYQVEWNKFHVLATSAYSTYTQFKRAVKSREIIKVLGITDKEWDNLLTALGKNYRFRLKRIFSRPQNIRLRLLAGSWVDYTKTVQSWWRHLPTINTPIYFVSSNSHSLLNLLTGYPLHIKKELLTLTKKHYPELWHTYEQIKSQDVFISEANFLYYVFKNFSTPAFQKELSGITRQLNFHIIESSHYLDVTTQIFPISSLLKSSHLDPRLIIKKPHQLASSKALIFNIDYPLGFAAYHILNEVFENVPLVKGVYILGKAAVLNSSIGDIEVSRLVHDEHTQNTYMFKNCFNTYFPNIDHQGSILTNQKAVSVLGTFLENDALLKKYSENNLTCVEMESGPYLSAITEATYDQQLPRGTIVDLNSAPMDIGIINYTSDNPYSLNRTLGDGFLGLNGLESVYLGSLAILQRIINLEESS